jgi:hypothetical protein
MSNTHSLRNDVEELARRRRLAAARQSRETEREALLQKLIETEQKAYQLRGWIRRWETKVDVTPEGHRLIGWAKAALSDMERCLEPAELAQLLVTRNLFPEMDDLADPLGDPPALRPWGR